MPHRIRLLKKNGGWGALGDWAYNVFGLGEGGLVGCSILAECFCPLLPSPCYRQ